MAKKPEDQKPEDDTPEQKKDPANDALMREIDDAVRQDDLRNFWQRYGKLLVAALILGLGSLAGWIYYQDMQQENSSKSSEEMVGALDALKKKDLDGAEKKLVTLDDAEQPGYRATALMTQASIAIDKKDNAKAVALYKKVAEDETLPKPYRDLALIRQTATEYQTLEPQVVVDRLKPLAVPGNAWFGSAGEMVAFAYRALGKDELAGPLFAKIGNDELVPASIRSRAVQMAGTMGVDAVDQKPADETETEAKTDGDKDAETDGAATPIKGE